MEELYRYQVDEYVLEYVQVLSSKDFIAKDESAIAPRKGKRIYLNDKKTNHFMKGVKEVFKSDVKASTIRAGGKKKRLETLINEEALMLGKYIRDEKSSWVPR